MNSDSTESDTILEAQAAEESDTESLDTTSVSSGTSPEVEPESEESDPEDKSPKEESLDSNSALSGQEVLQVESGIGSTGTMNSQPNDILHLDKILERLDNILIAAKNARAEAENFSRRADQQGRDASKKLEEAKQIYENWGSVSVLFGIEESQSNGVSQETPSPSQNSHESKVSSNWTVVEKLFFSN
ncbi:hypothetical protein NDI52_31170 [Leptolyngbya sp. PL-A3]|uniref:hypothetical protein n=1 Tax=Leptolyngbya sp. PL-A3 TaxID=2933911 RepID=UPI00329A7A2A